MCFLLEGKIPGVLYGVDDDRNVLKRMVTIEKKKLLKELNQKGRSFENTLYNLVLESEAGSSSHLVVPRQAQFCPCKFSPRLLPSVRLANRRHYHGSSDGQSSRCQLPSLLSWNNSIAHSRRGDQ